MRAILHLLEIGLRERVRVHAHPCRKCCCRLLLWRILFASIAWEDKQLYLLALLAALATTLVFCRVHDAALTADPHHDNWWLYNRHKTWHKTVARPARDRAGKRRVSA